MKMLLSAIALTIASPVLAQTTTPTDPHAGHNAQAKAPEAGPSANPHAGHDMTGMKDGRAMKAHCEKMKAEGKAMKGCEMHSKPDPKAHPHADHNKKPR